MEFKNRDTTSFNLSIGTGLTFESLFNPTTARYDETREIPNKIDLNEYDFFIINAQTLTRNIIQSSKKSEGRFGPLSYEKDIRQSNKLKDKLTSTIIDELYTIKTLFENNTNCKPILFLSAYKGIVKMLQKNRDRLINESKSYRESLLLSKEIFNYFKDESKKILGTFETDYMFPKEFENKRLLVFTHVNYDLFNRARRLALIESHTGKLRTKNSFAFRLYPIGKEGKDYDNIPFLEETLYVMGDRNFVKPLNIKVRRMMLEISKKYRWTSVSTAAGIRESMARTPELDGALFDFKRWYT